MIAISRKLVVCEINQEYLKKVKKQMSEQKMPVPKDDMHITISHKPLTIIEIESGCDCKVCKKLNSI